ncbi:stress response protein nst1-like isoform X2 [Odontomachus brunneus]|nr:stress response protein nst1-like isoform X2 [Odontomachus brunneus]
MIARKVNSLRMHDPNRLVGGADVPEERTPEPEPEPKAETEPVNASLELDTKISQPPSPSDSPSTLVQDTVQSEVEAKDSEDKQPSPASGPCCVCVSQTSGVVRDRKVDEIIEYVHQNLEEAVKALATLGENFEHDLKLMFVDILGRIQQWSGIVQNKLGSCKNEVNNLSKELLARACEVADLKAQIADYQNKLTSRVNGQPRRNDKRRTNNQLKEQYNLETTLKEVGEDKKYDDIAEELDKEKIEEIVERTEDEEEERERRDTEEEWERKEIEEQERRETEEKKSARDRKTKEDIFTTVSVQTIAQEKERIRRESELETEISQLRKENDRIMKERAEYENAIQRALLRGVSSLNVEALRVLRCPPIPCCVPCAPCPATAIVPPEPVVSCPMRNKKRRPESATATICSKTSNDRNDRKNEHQAYSTTKRSCGTPCCSSIPARSRKLTDSNMFLLLRQSDAANLRGPDKSTTTVCESPVMGNIEIPLLPKFGM